MRKKGINNYSGTILILGLFLLDSLLGSVTIFMGQAETVEEWAEQINLFVGLRSIMNIAPYTIILILMNTKVYISVEDEALVLLCFMMSALDSVDYFVNNNWRPVWMDWIVFTFVALILIGHKIRRSLKP